MSVFSGEVPRLAPRRQVVPAPRQPIKRVREGRPADLPELSVQTASARQLIRARAKEDVRARAEALMYGA